MENPFRQRSTEYLREHEAFLAIVTPEPLRYYLSAAGRDGRLYDRLVMIRGTPGSGKTTLARIFEFPTIHTLCQNQNFEGHKDITAALDYCGALDNSLPMVLGCRLALETDSRSFWEFDYPEDLRSNLMTAFLQARAVLGWFRHLSSANIMPDQVSISVRPENSELTETIGGTNGASIRNRAAEVEAAIYQVINTLVAPPLGSLPDKAIAPYRPFDIIDKFHFRYPYTSGDTISVIPLAIFDDAHVLHPDQFRYLEQFLLRRELRVARWLIFRFDVLQPHETLSATLDTAMDISRFPGVSADRVTEPILLQSSGKRKADRTQFRQMAKDMAKRYLGRMPLLSERGLRSLQNLLSDQQPELPRSTLEKLNSHSRSVQSRLMVTDDDVAAIDHEISNLPKAKSEDLRLQMRIIMMHRLANRRRNRTPQLFSPDEGDSFEIEVAANRSVYNAALLQLAADHGRPYFYGIDTLCDASSENAEQFLHLTSELVEEVVAQIARGKTATLTPKRQDQLLRKKAMQIMHAWRFPHVDRVTRLVNNVANKCIAKSREPNGAVMANAIAIPQDEFFQLPDSHPKLAVVLQFAIAYNAFLVVPDHSCKGKTWCLFELGGIALLRYGLTLNRGGFIESSASELARLILEGEDDIE